VSAERFGIARERKFSSVAGSFFGYLSLHLERCKSRPPGTVFPVPVLGSAVMVMKSDSMKSDPLAVHLEPGGAVTLSCQIKWGWLTNKAFLQQEGVYATESIAEQGTLQEPASKQVLDERKARIAAGLCPKCGNKIAHTDQNCPSCRINLTFAREHLAEW
jgi:hypothetical protein